MPRRLHQALRRGGAAALALVLALGVVACGDDDPAAPSNDNDLTQAEAEVMMEALVAAGGSFFFAPPGSFGVPAAQSQNFDQTVPCPQGGEVRVSGSISGDFSGSGDDGTLSMNVTQVHDDCTSRADSDGSTWTFNGNPNVQLSFDWTVTGDDVSMSGTQTGGISFSSGSTGGSCSVDLSYDFDVSSSGQSVSGSVQGSVCGFNVSETFSASDF